MTRKMKNGSIEWIGQISENANVTTVEKLFNIILGKKRVRYKM